MLFAQHHWPRWGRERIVDFLAKQRDLYGYIHDQTLRLLNKGYVGSEIAEDFELPPSLEREWHCRGYYGSLSHNVKAVYQRYLGWFDGNPAHLWPHPPVAAATRYVELAGRRRRAARERPRGVRATATTAGSPRSSTTSCSPTPTTPRRESCRRRRSSSSATAPRTATWRNFFLMGAHELREGVGGTAAATAPPDIVRNLSAEQLFDALAIRIDGPRAGDRRIALHWRFTDTGEDHRLTLEHGVLTPAPRARRRRGRRDGEHRARGAQRGPGAARRRSRTSPRAGGCGSRATRRSSASCSACSTRPTRASRSSRHEPDGLTLSDRSAQSPGSNACLNVNAPGVGPCSRRWSRRATASSTEGIVPAGTHQSTRCDSGSALNHSRRRRMTSR